MPRELVPHCLADRPGAASVDDAHLGAAGEGRGVDEDADRLAGLLGSPPAEIELARRVGRRRRANGHDLLDRVVGLRVPVRAEARKRDPYAETTAADDHRLLLRKLRDRAADAELRCDDGIA